MTIVDQRHLIFSINGINWQQVCDSYSKTIYMAEEKTEMNKPDKSNENAMLKPDPETLNTTDPQEHMKGPVSSTMQGIKEEAKKNDKVSKEEADKKREENM